MDFEAVFILLLQNFEKYKIRFALIGGFALHTAGLSRTTQDIDFLIAKEDMPKVKQFMLSAGYEALHESEDITNFAGKLKELGQVDFLHAHRKYTKKFLEDAQEKDILNGKFKIRVITPEAQIGLKVQSSSNDPKRYHQGIADIESLMQANAGRLDLNALREYFALFNRELEFEEILKRAGHAD